MIKELYYWFHQKTSRKGEQGEYSAGAWPAQIRDRVLGLCRKRTGNLLDLGCGEGFFISALLGEGVNITIYGLDNFEKNIIRARERLEDKRTNLLLGDAAQTPFKDGFFDTVVCNNFFIMLNSNDIARQILREAARIIKPGGKIIFEIRNALNPLIRIKYKLARFYDETVKNHPLKTYRPQDIELWLKESGFRVTCTSSIGFPIKNLAPIVIFEAEKC
jgi:ubiquinone/menaquinone biosynthesis C-methylase UbiE